MKERPEPSTSGRTGLQPSQQQMVTRLFLLLGGVLALLACAIGFWWASQPREPVRAGAVSFPAGAAPRVPAPLTHPAAPRTVERWAAPVATETVRRHPLAVVEVYPLKLARTPGRRVTVRSPGGIAADVLAQPSEAVSAGQALIRLRQTVTAPSPAHVRVARRPKRPAADAAQIARLQGRLAQLRARIDQSHVLSRAGTTIAPVQAQQAWAAARQADSEADQAQAVLVAARNRERIVDQRYAARLASPFQYHLARSAALLAEVQWQHAVNEAADARRAAAAQTLSANANGGRRVAALEAEARGIEARLGQIREQVAGARQSLPAPTARLQRLVTARAPLSGSVAVVRARKGKSLPPGAALVTIAAPGRIYGEARLPGALIRTFPAGARVRLRSPDGHTAIARVARARREPDGSGVLIIVPPAGASLERGSVVVPLRRARSSLTLPATALQRERTGAALWIATATPRSPTGWTARQRAVRAVVVGSQVRIVSGLRVGDRVIVAAGSALREGDPVAPVEVGSLPAG